MPRKKIHSIIGAKKKYMYMSCPTLPLLKPVLVLLEVCFDIFVSPRFGPFWSVLVRLGPFRSVSVNRDTAL